MQSGSRPPGWGAVKATCKEKEWATLTGLREAAGAARARAEPGAAAVRDVVAAAAGLLWAARPRPQFWHVPRRVNPEDTRLGVTSQPQKDKPCAIPLLQGIHTFGRGRDRLPDPGP